MKTNSISAKAAVNEYIRFTGHEGALNKSDTMAWTNDAVNRIATEEQFIQKIVLLRINDYKVLLPSDFKFVDQAAYRSDGADTSCIREEVTQWTQKAFGTNCELEINLVCPQCTKTNCSCGMPIIEVDADRLWKSANPQYANSYVKHFKGYNSNVLRDKCCDYHDDFKLMRHTTTSFFNIPYHLNNCPNFFVDEKVEYRIQPPSMIVNVRDGDVLLSYFGVETDAEGYRYIPDHVAVIRAISYELAERFAFIEYSKDRSQGNRIYWQQMVELTDKWVARAKSALQTPGFDEFHDFVMAHWHRIIPNYNWRNDLSKSRSDSFRYPDQTYNMDGYNHQYRNGSRNIRK